MTTTGTTPPDEFSGMVEALKLEQLDADRFRGHCPAVGWRRVYGGLVVAQSLAAAIGSLEEETGKTCHSLHGYFIRPGDTTVPIVYQVRRDRDGKSFASRRIVAVQHGEAIFTMSASFHRHETGYDHQIPMPDVPAPEALASEAELVREHGANMPENMQRYFTRKRAIELRPVDPDRYLAPAKGKAPLQHVWFRTNGALADDPVLHLCSLAYASDMTLLDTALVPHGTHIFDQRLMMASLDHALWFHRPCRADRWLLYAQESPTAIGARGLARGTIFDRQGRLIASVAQEGLARPRRPQ